MIEKTLLWLDDLRNPYLNWEERLDNEYLDYNIIWVRKYEEFIDAIERFGIPEVISFDHDLEKEHYTPEKYWDDYELSKLYQDINETGKSGYNCMQWLIKWVFENEVGKLPTVLVHSANPVGANRISDLWEKFEELREKL